jgi:hypothetical protein
MMFREPLRKENEEKISCVRKEKWRSEEHFCLAGGWKNEAVEQDSMRLS